MTYKVLHVEPCGPRDVFDKREPVEPKTSRRRATEPKTSVITLTEAEVDALIVLSGAQSTASIRERLYNNQPMRIIKGMMQVEPLPRGAITRAVKANNALYHKLLKARDER